MNQSNSALSDAVDAEPSTLVESASVVAPINVSVVVPVFNERDCVSILMETLVDLDANLQEYFAFEFILVDDGSSDETAEMLKAATAEKRNFCVVQHDKNRGIAAAIHTGLRHATSEAVVSIDADGSYDAMLIEELVPQLTDGVDLVTASPYHPLGKVKHVPAWRLWLSRRASGLYRLVMRTKLHCYTSCYRVYRRSRVVDLEPENSGYVGVAELLWRLDCEGGTIIEHPATLSNRLAGHSKMRVFRSALHHMHLITLIAKHRLRRA